MQLFANRMGNTLAQADTNKNIRSFKFEGRSGAVVGMQGWRPSMEDTHVFEPSLSWLPNAGFFGVFDGHGGGYTSSYCEEHIIGSLEEYASKQGITNPTMEDLANLLKQHFVQFDSEIRNANISRSGSTAICGLITDTHFIISNLGDSRCVLSRNGQANPLSVDHKPALEVEKRRILKAGGHVLHYRVNGDLAVSRAFGDFSFKQNDQLSPLEQQVSCEPDVRIIKREEEDNYIVFACDGVWDVYSNPRDFVTDFNNLLESYETLEEAVCQMLDMCLEKGSRDNISLMVILLNSAPKPILSKIERRKEKEKEQRKRLEEEKRKRDEECLP